MPRVRAGKQSAGQSAHIHCGTCRKRKIRCGKQRPSCHQCLQARRKCEGYNTWEVTLLASEQQQVAQQSLPSWIDQPPRVYVHDVEIHDEMRHAFDYFRHCSLKKYAERGYPTSWSYRAIVVCASEPAVFFALVALGSLESSTHEMVHTSLARPADPSRTTIVLDSYTTAIRHMGRMVHGVSLRSSSLEPVIVGCAVFVVLEVMRGNALATMLHARIGNRLLQERLGQAQLMPESSHGSRSALGMSQDIEVGIAPDLNHTFSTMDEARECLEMLVNAGQDIQGDLMQLAGDAVHKHLPRTILEKPASRFCLVHDFSKSIPLASSNSTEQRLERIRRGYVHWRRAFVQLTKEADHSVRKALTLQVRFFCGNMAIHSCRRTDEQWTDSCYELFASTLNAIETMLQRHHPDPPIMDSLMERLDSLKARERASCSFDMDGDRPQTAWGPLHTSTHDNAQATGLFGQGILSALFTIACKCRFSVLRKRAAQLLCEMNRVEGPNTSRELGRFAKATISLEERQSRLLTSDQHPSSGMTLVTVPEAARVGDMVAQADNQNNAIHLTCAQYVLQDRRQVLLKEYKCIETNRGELIHELVHTWQGTIPHET